MKSLSGKRCKTCKTPLSEINRSQYEYCYKHRENHAVAIKQRLIKVIKNLEIAQNKDYQSMRHLILSYLYDIRDDRVPNYVMELPMTFSGRC
jgi:hypothetical protein